MSRISYTKRKFTRPPQELERLKSSSTVGSSPADIQEEMRKRKEELGEILKPGGCCVEGFRNLERVRRKAEAQKALESGEFPPPTRTPINLKQLPTDGRSMISTMQCLNCHRIPTLYQRYLCPKGHMYCYDCGQDKIKHHQSRCVSEYDENENKTTVSIGMPVSVEVGGSNSTTSSLSAAAGSLLEIIQVSPCDEKIRLYPADPIFSAM